MTTIEIINLDGHQVYRVLRRGYLVGGQHGGYYRTLDAVASALVAEGIDPDDVEVRP